MTTTLERPAIQKNFKGGWKDRALRNNPASLGAPLTGPVRSSGFFSQVHERPVVVEGIFFARSGRTAFEICACGVPTGVWYTVTQPEGIHDSRVLHQQDRVYDWGRCVCVPEGATLLDVKPVLLEQLLTGQALAVVRRVGVADTHELAAFGYNDFEALPGVGPTTVEALRNAITSAGLPAWRATA